MNRIMITQTQQDTYIDYRGHIAFVFEAPILIIKTTLAKTLLMTLRPYIDRKREAGVKTNSVVAQTNKSWKATPSDNYLSLADV